MDAILVSNGPGELYTWVQPVLRELQQHDPSIRVHICLIPCQFASGSESRIAESFGATSVSNPSEVMRFISLGQKHEAFKHLGAQGVVVSLGGNTSFALQLGQKLNYPTYRYSFVPYWHKKLRKLYVHDEKTYKKARLLGAPAKQLLTIGNLVADAVEAAEPVKAIGSPHILLMCGSRDIFAQHMIPAMALLAEALQQLYPKASFVSPLSRMLKPQTLEKAYHYKPDPKTFGVSTSRLSNKEGDWLITPKGTAIKIIPEHERYAHMRSADIALTIPGTNTLELGIAALPSVVILSLNKPEVIPLEGFGHWLGLIPVVGKALKAHAVKLIAPHLPVSLPNSFSGEDLMVEIKGIVQVQQVIDKATMLLENHEDYNRRKAGLQAHMPKAGAAKRLVADIMQDIQA